MNTDPLTKDLPRALRRSGTYALRRVDGHLNIYMDYTNHPEFDGNDDKCSMLIRECISHAEDFDTHVDDLEEEMRCLRADYERWG